MTNYKDLKLEKNIKATGVKVHDIELEVTTYLPTPQKIALIEYVVDHALDENTGRFSPVRTNLFFNLALVHYYAGISFEDDVDAIDAYDTLESTGTLDAIISAIPQDEYVFMKDLVDETCRDIADFNSSFAGVMRIASTDTGGLDNQITEILEKVKNREGMELLGEIKNVVGKD